MNPAFDRIAAEIADDFLDAELDSDTEAKAWLVEKVAAALGEAEERGYKRAMANRF